MAGELGYRPRVRLSEYEQLHKLLPRIQTFCPDVHSGTSAQYVIVSLLTLLEEPRRPNVPWRDE